MSNQLVSNPDIQFNPVILEDPINHLMRSNNQLIVDVQSQLNQPLIGVFPYASFIDFDSASGLRSLATTQPEAIVQINNDRIEGPFPSLHNPLIIHAHTSTTIYSSPIIG